MTQAEKILIRYLSGLAAALSVGSAALLGFEADVSRTVLIAVSVGSASLSAFVTAVTAEAVSRTMGVRGS